MALEAIQAIPTAGALCEKDSNADVKGRESPAIINIAAELAAVVERGLLAEYSIRSECLQSAKLTVCEPLSLTR